MGEGRDALWAAQLSSELHRPPRPPRGLPARAAFGRCVASPALQHKAWQARFHSAVASLSHWRATVVLWQQPLAVPAAEYDAAAVVPGCGHKMCQPEAQEDKGSGSILRAWRCAAVTVQHHEQSVWVRFSLPPALATDHQVQEGCRDDRLVSPGWLAGVTTSDV